MRQWLSSIFHKPQVQEFIKFCVVGVLCTAIDAAIFFALHEWLGYQIALICGYILSLSVNYILNIYWSFKEKPSVKNAVGLVSAHLFNLFVVRMSLMWLFVNILELSDSLAYIPMLAISMVTNFFIVRFAVKNKLSS